MSTMGYEEEDWSTSFIEESADFEIAVLMHMFLLAVGVYVLFPPKARRNSPIYEQRMCWEAYCEKHVQRWTFKQRLRMSKQSFDLLLSYVRHYLVVNEEMANMRGGSICPEICLYCTIRWLAGGSYLDITDICGISKASFYRVIWKTITAIVLAPELAIAWPESPEAIQDNMADFASISFSCAINNCVGVGDGFLLRIKLPSKRDAKNIRSFFSGHYQCYGLNIQAVCDRHCRFIFMAVAGPGVAKDRQAARACGLMDLVSKLPNGTCIIVDAAYEPTENMVPVYQGVDKFNPRYDNFNFYASQLRIRIEMAFGILTNKWGILQRPVGVALKNVKWMVQAIGRLHNFVINERLKEQGIETAADRRVHSNDDEAMTAAVAEGRGYLPSVPEDENGDPVNLDPIFNTASIASIAGHSELREAMARRIERLGLKRPASNRIRKHST
jgi:DDE superfamily endonuclease